ncbi:hypothetical protein [Gordonia sihwensis]|uniref:hypothetical protein n=1 Tax=Gordonia sihwensis TaxID=173559 RepID=UPI003D98BFB7
MTRAEASETQPVVVVAHSGANSPMSLVLDRHPGLIGRVVWVDSGPVASGSVFAPDASDDSDELPLPPFDVLGQQAGLEGLSPDALDRFRVRAVPEPGPVLRGAWNSPTTRVWRSRPLWCAARFRQRGSWSRPKRVTRCSPRC